MRHGFLFFHIFQFNYFFVVCVFRYCLIHTDFQLLLHFFAYAWFLLPKRYTATEQEDTEKGGTTRLCAFYQ